jgi:hypothetical protein
MVARRRRKQCRSGMIGFVGAEFDDESLNGGVALP